jgi:protein-S-isoprenylcysteine O-methyltransferase Ste14
MNYLDPVLSVVAVIAVSVLVAMIFGAAKSEQRILEEEIAAKYAELARSVAEPIPESLSSL